MNDRLDLRTRPSKSRACLLAIGLPVLLLLLIVLSVALPWLDKNRYYEDEIDNRTGKLRRFAAINAEKPRLQAELDRINQEIRDSDYYVQADKPALAAAKIQQQIKRVVESNGGQLTSTQALPAKADGDLTQIQVRVRISGDMDTVLKSLHALESSRPLLMLENFTVRSRSVRQRTKNRRKAGTRQGQAEPPEMSYSLNVNFDVVGYLRATAA